MTTCPHAATPRESRGKEQIRILIVDDEPDLADMLADAVRAFGYRSAIAFNGVQAVRAAREFSPHVVLLDIRMPGIDGHGVLDHLRARSSAPAIIVISGNADEEEARALLQRGAFDYVMKPIDLVYLEQAIVAALGSLAS
jgi:two-component system, OmpR family, response regulator